MVNWSVENSWRSTFFNKTVKFSKWTFQVTQELSEPVFELRTHWIQNSLKAIISLTQSNSTHYTTQKVANPRHISPQYAGCRFRTDRPGANSAHSRTEYHTKGDVITCVNKWSSYHPLFASPHGPKLANLPVGMRLMWVCFWVLWWEMIDNLRCVNLFYN
jgi:hypothetical protein